MVAHAILLHNIYGNTYGNYKSFFSTFTSLFLFMLGDEQYADFMWSNLHLFAEVLGKFAFFSFSSVMIVFIVSLVVSIIDVAMRIGNEENQKANKENYELAGYMANKLKSLFEGSGDMPERYRVILERKGAKRQAKLAAAGDELEKVIQRLDRRINDLADI